MPSWALLFIIRIITFIFYGCIGLKTNVIQDRLYSLLLLILKAFKILLWAPKRILVPIPTVVFLGGTVVKNLPVDAGDARDVSSIPGFGRSPGEGNGFPMQYSCLENSMDRGAWRTIVQVLDTSERLAFYFDVKHTQNTSYSDKKKKKTQMVSITWKTLCVIQDTTVCLQKDSRRSSNHYHLVGLQCLSVCFIF